MQPLWFCVEFLFTDNTICSFILFLVYKQKFWRAVFKLNKAIITAFWFFLFHLFLAYYFELIDDEVYYNLWLSSISFGYYDRLPMIAWWIYAGKFFFGETVIVVRILTYVAFFLVSILIARMVFWLVEEIESWCQYSYSI